MSCEALQRFGVAVAGARDALGEVRVDALAPVELARAVVEARRQAAALTAAVAHLAARAEARTALVGRGATSAETFLAGAAHGSISGARADLEVGRAMDASTVIADAVGAGSVSLDNARLLGAVAEHPGFAADADHLVSLAATLSPRRLRDELADWRQRVDPSAEADRVAVLRHRRYLRFTDLPDGLTRVDGLLTAPDASTVRAALDHLVAGQHRDGTGRDQGQRSIDAVVELCAAYAAGTVTGGRECPQVSVSIGLEALTTRTGRAATAHGTVTAAQARQWCCDANIHRVITNGRSSILDVGTAQRTATDAQFKALVARDHTCVFPNCDRPPAWCHAHHVIAWEDGGPTNLANLALVCSAHHHGTIHNDGWTLHWHPDIGWIPYDPHGNPHPDAPTREPEPVTRS